MKLEIGVSPNCSEATIRIRTDGQKAEKIQALIKELEEHMDPSKLMPGEWDDTDSEDQWSEGYVNERSIFGMNVLEISGDAPFNYGEQVFEVIKKYLPEAEAEYTE
jgi:hypothetical protein